MIRSSTAPAALSVNGFVAPPVVLAGVLAREEGLLRPARRLAEVVGGGSVDDRVQPAAKLALGAAVKRGGDRAYQRVVGHVLEHVRRNAERETAPDVALISEHQQCERPAAGGQLAVIARRPHIGDESVVAEPLKLDVGERKKGHGCHRPWIRSAN